MRRQAFLLIGLAALLLASGTATAQVRGCLQVCPPAAMSPGFRGSTGIHFFGPTQSPGSLANRFPPAPAPVVFPAICQGTVFPVFYPFAYSYANVNYGYSAPQNGYAPSYSITQPATTTPEILTGPAQAGTSVRLDVWVPFDAEVWVGDQKLTQVGLQRRYVSSALGPGIYTLDVTMRRLINGQLVTETRRVHLQAGEWKSVDFYTAPPKEAAASSKPDR